MKDDIIEKRIRESVRSKNKSSSFSSGEAIVASSTKSPKDRQVSSRAGGNNWGNNDDRRNGRCPAYILLTNEFRCQA